MKISELRQKTKDDLEKMLLDSREKLRGLRFDLASGKVKNVKAVRGLRKDIAKTLTALSEKS